MAGHYPFYNGNSESNELEKIKKKIEGDYKLGKLIPGKKAINKKIDKRTIYEDLKTVIDGDISNYKIDPSNPNEQIFTIVSEFEGNQCIIEIHIDKKEDKILELFLIL